MKDKPNAPRKKAEAADADKGRKGKSASEALGRSKRRPDRAAADRRVDHTPPPLSFRTGSFLIETDLPFNAVDGTGGAGHPHRHRLPGTRPVRGVKIVDDAGDTLYLNPAADGCSIKIWWDRTQATEQILVDSDFSIAVDENLGFGAGSGSNISVPPDNPIRFKRYTHPNVNARSVQQVEVVKSGRTRFFEDSRRIAEVMVWFTS